MPVNAETLLGHAEWIRRLARSLAPDAHTADDLIQETWLAALERPPRDGENVRGWLHTVLRNLCRKRDRSDGRRSRREATVAKGGTSEATDAVVAKLSAQRAVVDAVLGLAEPYRTVIAKRYLDGLPPRKIARELGIPVATVNTRLARGLERLRNVLDRRFDGRHAWCAALLGVRRFVTPQAAAPLSGALLLNAKLKTCLAIAAVACGGTILWPLLDLGAPAATPQPAPVPSLSSALAAPPDTAPAPPRTEPSRTAAPLAEREPRAPAPAPIHLTGTVVDLDEVPVGGVHITAHRTADGERSEAVSDDRGRFTLREVPPRATIETDDPAYATVFESRLPARAELADFEPVIVVARARRIDGRVVDESGAPIAGASATIDFDPGLRARFSRILDDAATPFPRTRSTRDGAFAFAEIGIVPNTVLTVTKTGFKPFACRVDGPNTGPIAVRLERPALAEGVISGHVMDPRSRPVGGAHVALGHTTTQTDANGAFRFEIDRIAQPDRLVALAPGYLPVTVEAQRNAEGEARWPRYVHLQLEGQPKAIAGRVVDARGAPLEGVRVWTLDRTKFGFVAQRPSVIEPILRGLPLPSERQARIREASGGDREKAIELGDNTPSMLWSWVLTDRDGRFRLDGLLDRPYRLRAMDPVSLLNVDSTSIAAGTEDVTITLPTDATLAVVSARVVTRAGAPVAGVEVRSVALASTIEFERSQSMKFATGARTRTDADGRFTLRNLPAKNVSLRLSGKNIMPRSVGDDDGLAATLARAGSDPTITVDQRVHFKIELLGDATRADTIRVLDAAGETLSLTVFSAWGRTMDDSAKLEEGKTPTIAVPETAATLELHKGETLVQSVPLILVPGELNLIQL